MPSLVPVIVWSGSRHHHIYPYPAHTPHLSVRTHCTRYLTVYVHIHNFSTLLTYPASLPLSLLCPQSSPHLPLKPAFPFPFLPSVYLFPIYYTIKQKLCNSFFPFLSSITRSYYNYYYYREKPIPDRQDFPFFYIFFFFLTLPPSYYIHSFTKPYNPTITVFYLLFKNITCLFLFFCLWLVLFFSLLTTCMLGYR